MDGWNWIGYAIDSLIPGNTLQCKCNVIYLVFVLILRCKRDEGVTLNEFIGVNEWKETCFISMGNGLGCSS